MVRQLKRSKQEEVKQKDVCRQEKHESALKQTQDERKLEGARASHDSKAALALTFAPQIDKIAAESDAVEANLAELKARADAEEKAITEKIKGDQESIGVLQEAVQLLSTGYRAHHRLRHCMSPDPDPARRRVPVNGKPAGRLAGSPGTGSQAQPGGASLRLCYHGAAADQATGSLRPVARRRHLHPRRGARQPTPPSVAFGNDSAP